MPVPPRKQKKQHKACQPGQKPAARSELQQLLLDVQTFAIEGNQSPEHVDKISCNLDQVPLNELGVRQDAHTQHQHPKANGLSQQASGISRVEYFHVYEDSLLSVGIFKVAAGTSLPLHNHPAMTVWSRVLYGKVHIRAFNWVGDSTTGNQQETRLAQLQADCDVGDMDPPSVLTPDCCNIHCFTALEDAVVLDVLVPPYNPDIGRDCIYYRELAPQATSVGDTVLLQECEPDGFEVVGRPYTGISVSL